MGDLSRILGREAEKRREIGEFRSPKSVVERGLVDELEGLKQRVSLGHEVGVKWASGTIKFRNGRQLDEEVGDMILIYTEEGSEALKLVRHGFAE